MPNVIVVSKNKSTRARVYARYAMMAYNKAKVCGEFEINRVHRAFGLAFKELVTGEDRGYQTTLKRPCSSSGSRRATKKHCSDSTLPRSRPKPM